jgi:hypothetical protein
MNYSCMELGVKGKKNQCRKHGTGKNVYVYSDKILS